jgi:hypothetical protein
MTNSRAIKELKPLGEWVLVNKCFNDHLRQADGEVLLYMPESKRQTTDWCEILDVGPKCRVIRREMCDGRHFVIVPELDNRMEVVRIDDENEYRFIKEEVFLEKGPNRGFVYVMPEGE